MWIIFSCQVRAMFLLTHCWKFWPNPSFAVLFFFSCWVHYCPICDIVISFPCSCAHICEEAVTTQRFFSLLWFSLTRECIPLLRYDVLIPSDFKRNIFCCKHHGKFLSKDTNYLNNIYILGVCDGERQKNTDFFLVSVLEYNWAISRVYIAINYLKLTPHCFWRAPLSPGDHNKRELSIGGPKIYRFVDLFDSYEFFQKQYVQFGWMQ